MMVELHHTFFVSLYCGSTEEEITPFAFESYIFGKQEKLVPSLRVDEDLAPHLVRSLFEMLVGPPYSRYKAGISWIVSLKVLRQEEKSDVQALKLITLKPILGLY